MAEKMYTFIVIKFPFQTTAATALSAVRRMEKDGVLKLKDAVAITKTEDGKIKLHQSKDDTIGKGLLKGGLIGVVFGILFGGIGWVLAGALSGAALGTIDRGIKDKLLRELGEEMELHESALAVLIEEADWERLEAHVDASFSGEVVIREQVGEDMQVLEDAADKVVGEDTAVEDEFSLKE